MKQSSINFMIRLPILFARTNTGAVQQWTVNISSNKYQTEFGQVDGKIQTTKWTICEGTNIGRSNERTAEEQALFEAKALWKKKKDSGYFENIQEIDVAKFVEPMLAKNFEDYQNELTFPVYSQPKLDGIRCIATKDGLFSRNGKTIVSCPHLIEALQQIFEKYPSAVLDGELYNNDLKDDFNKICSLVKKTKPTSEDLLEAKQSIQYWVYDTVKDDTFYERGKWVNETLKSNEWVKIVPTAICNSQKELDECYGKYINLGYEGQMVRLNGNTYENKRSKNLLKRKEFQDKEYVILDIIEGEGNKQGMAGAMVFQNDQGYQFNSNIKGSREYLTEVWKNKKEYKGKLATVKYFNLTPENNIPRFPYVIGVRDYE